MTGKVFIVGAGPGDPDLITVKALRLIQTGDVIIHDRLIPEGLLDYSREDAEIIDAGKEPTKHRLQQTEINALIADRAIHGKTVVRLKGGDPLVFGRGSEEALACFLAGIPFEIVPGISSSYAVPAYAGIPLTHRHISSSFTVITGHEDPAKSESSIDYAALARLHGTIVILMGVKQLSQITTRLVEAGLPGETPASMIENGTMSHQRVIDSTLANIAEQATEANIQPPAITVIGHVVSLRERGTIWYEPANAPA